VHKPDAKHQLRTLCVGALLWNVDNAGVDALCSAMETWHDCPTIHNKLQQTVDHAKTTKSVNGHFPGQTTQDQATFVDFIFRVALKFFHHQNSAGIKLRITILCPS